MKQKNGFTLVELLATISILVIIVSIAIPSIINIRSNNEDKNERNIMATIETAAESYIYSYNLYDKVIDSTSSNRKCIAITEHIDKGLLKNDNNINVLKNSEYVSIYITDNEIKYELESNRDRCDSEIVYVENETENDDPSNPDHETTSEEEEAKYRVDYSGANPPILSDGLIPVRYDETKEAWVKADITNSASIKWYDYDNKQWANAVTVTSSSRTDYQNATPGTTVDMSNIESMWVWIPRFKYRITFQSIGVQNSHSHFLQFNEEPGIIDIVFERGTATTGASYREAGVKNDSVIGRNMSTLAISEYYTHPAFRDGSNVYNSSEYDLGGWNKELTGFWVGKFETGNSISNPLIKPNITSISSTLSNHKNSTKLFTSSGNKYGLSTSWNSHMMKNTEWGAVAYLSQSKYGKASEIYPNRNSSYTTGCSTGVSSCGTYEAPNSDYNEYSDCDSIPQDICIDDNKTSNSKTRMSASTTGNVYGIYDMNGGRNEVVMGGTANVCTSRNVECDYYPSGSELYSSRKLGDATFETRQWYRSKFEYINGSINHSFSTIPSSELPSDSYILRGGSYNSEWRVYEQKNYLNAGIFYVEFNISSSDTTYRNVLIP